MSKPGLLIGVLGLSLVACGRPTVDEVITRMGPPICEKLQECTGDATFSKAFPNGVDECAARTSEKVRTDRSADLDKRSVCTDEEVEQCLRELEVLACPADLDDLRVPCDC